MESQWQTCITEKVIDQISYVYKAPGNKFGVSFQLEEVSETTIQNALHKRIETLFLKIQLDSEIKSASHPN